jgi:hypothetical protein
VGAGVEADRGDRGVLHESSFGLPGSTSETARRSLSSRSICAEANRIPAITMSRNPTSASCTPVSCAMAMHSMAGSLLLRRTGVTVATPECPARRNFTVTLIVGQ